MNNKWQSTEKALPTWEDGEVLLMLPDSRIVRGRYNEMAMWWRIKTKDGVARLEDEEVRYWKPLNVET